MQMSGVFAEFEQAMLRERVNAGLARAKAQGKTLGRPRARGASDNAILKLRNAGMGVQAIRQKLALRCRVGAGGAEGGGIANPDRPEWPHRRPLGEAAPRCGKKWSGVHRILRHAFVRGA